MKTFGALLIVLGFALWFGGELLAIQPYNVAGMPMVFVGVIPYFVGREKTSRAGTQREVAAWRLHLPAFTRSRCVVSNARVLFS